MLYSPSVHCIRRTDRLASGPVVEGLGPGGLKKPSANAASRPKHLDGAKEAQGIGMTRGFASLLSNRFASRSILFSALLILLGVSAAPAHAQSASGWNKRGQAAELKEDYDTAYECYLKAHQKSPKDMRYLTRLDRMRFQAAAQHVDRGRVLRQNGDIPGALNNFARALEIDPSDEAARQEIEITEHSEKIPGVIPVAPPGAASSSALVNEVSLLAPPAELKPISSDLVTLNMASEDTKLVYQAIGKFAGINVLFDPDFTSKRIPVDLKSVSLGEALRIVGLVSDTFYKVLTPDTIYVATNNHQKHADLDDQAIQTFYLTNSTSQADINEIQAALRQILTQDDKTFVVPSQDAIVVRAAPSHLMLVEKLLNDLDRTKAEVTVDVAILEVNRDKMRNLGMTLPQSFTITPQTTPNSTNTVSSATSGTPLASNFTLNTLANINATNFAVTIGGGTLNALLSDGDTRVLQNPTIRATDGQNATLKIGTRVPIATGTYNAGTALGTAGLGGIGSQTQFTYQDVGVTIDMTPQIHIDRQISLKLDIEDSTEAGSVSEGNGLTEPIFGQRISKGTIQLRDGEPCLLAGFLSKTDNSTTSGTPGLVSIPLLKYVFGSVNKEVAQDEIVFVLVPHIVRESPLTRLNTRAIDTGTSTDIQIRKSDSPAFDALFPANPEEAPLPKITAAQGADAMVGQIAQQATRTPGVTQPPAAVGPMPQGPAQNPSSAGPATPVPNAAKPAVVAAPQPVGFVVTPPNSNQAVGSEFNVSIVLTNAHDVFSVPVQVQFDPKILQLVNVDTGGLLGGDGQPVALVHRDEGNGLVTITASRPPGTDGVNAAQGQVCIL
ncbi:MAG TPA: cohesin domain-containing protein, partial [Acidobacteriaceae bacterium]|nr:cohesin domain-containing protein [Acidobacteriaceae bacterium]